MKVWQRFAEAAADASDLDLTVYFLGDSENVIKISDNCRLHTLPPKLGTDWFRWLNSGAGHTDLATYHHTLAERLTDRNILIGTDHFSFGRTAAKVAASRNIPIAHSIHTDVETLARTYGPIVVRNVLGKRIGNKITKYFDLGTKIGNDEKRKLISHISECDHVFVSRDDDKALLDGLDKGICITELRRGIDLDAFSPRFRDKDWLFYEYGVPQASTLLMFAGRFDGSKNALIAARTVRVLLDKGYDLYFFVAGQGADIGDARDMLGDRLVAPGFLDQPNLARAMASADLFLFPSESETFGNVVLEARASGLPSIVSSRPGGTGRWIHQPGKDGMIVTGADLQSWIEITEATLGMDLEIMGQNSRHMMERHAASWATVFEEDLLRPWRCLVESRNEKPRLAP